MYSLYTGVHKHLVLHPDEAPGWIVSSMFVYSSILQYLNQLADFILVTHGQKSANQSAAMQKIWSALCQRTLLHLAIVYVLFLHECM